MQKKRLRDIEINKELFQQIWKKLNETKVEDIIPYLKKNKKTVLIAGLGIAALIGAVYLVKLNTDFFNSDKGKTAATTPPAGVDPKLPVTTFLPQEKRTIDQEAAVKDPFAGRMKLKGIMTGGGGANLAIIESGNTSYVAKAGTELSKGLFVEEIRPDVVVLKSTDERMYLEFNGRTKTEKLNTTSTQKIGDKPQEQNTKDDTKQDADKQ